MDPPKPTSQNPDNNDAYLKEMAAILGKQQEDSAAIAKKVEALKSQLENKYKTNMMKRQISFQDDTQTTQLRPNHYAKSSLAYRNHKSVSFVTRPTFVENDDDEETNTEDSKEEVASTKEEDTTTAGGHDEWVGGVLL